MPKRVCFFIQSFRGDGAQLQLVHLINEMQKDPKYQITVVYIDDGPRLASLDKSRVEIIKYRGGSSIVWLSIFSLARDIRRNKIDVLVTWLVAPDVIGFLASRFTRTRWIVGERNSIFEGQFIFKVRRVVGRWADKIIANSEAGKNYWLKAWPKLDAIYIPNIVNLAQIATPQAKTIDVITVGRLHKQKDPVRMARVLALFVQLEPSTKTMMIGEGELFDEVLAVLGDTESIRLPGYVSNAAEVIASAKVLLHLSLDEGQPNAVLEAVALNAIPVVSDIPEHREVLGPDYPFYVSSDASEPEVVELIQIARISSPDCLAYAKARIAEQTVEKITARYKAAIDSV